MGERVFLVHGWSVSETSTYQALHLQLGEHGFQLEDIYLGRYVSLEDRVEIRDIAKAMHLALEEKLAGDWNTPFHIITHSTGALVVRHWITHHYLPPYCDQQPLRNLIFLAGPQFGSRLAHHGRSMLAHARYMGDTGDEVLKALELGSAFSWQLNGDWLDSRHWQDKGVRPYCLIGDKVEKSLLDRFAAAILPAAYEAGSDMVVRCAASNLNFSRYELHADSGEFRKVGSIEKVPFAALYDYVHSGTDNGIMNSIKRRSTPFTHRALKLILDCLRVTDDADYLAMETQLGHETAATRLKRPGFAQLDFRFRDEAGQPIEDYVFKLGWLDANGKQRPSAAITHTHKNIAQPNHFCVFVEYAKLEPKVDYFIEFDSSSGSELFDYQPDPFPVQISSASQLLGELIKVDRTTQIDIVLQRTPKRNLFVFHRGDDKLLHVKWNRAGEVVKTKIASK